MTPLIDTFHLYFSIYNSTSPLVIKPDSLFTPELGRNDLTRSLKKQSKVDSSFLTSLVAGGDKRKDSMESDNSSESSGESLFKVNQSL